MKHELKIILGATVQDTMVLVDEQPIGYIQDIKFHASVKEARPLIEIVFPNLLPFESTNKDIVEILKRQLNLLKDCPNVNVILEDIKFE